MSERKVLNKYYPPDFNPALIPKLRLDKYRQYQIRTMAPFNMRCKTCGEFIYKGKKFNSRKETVKGENYLGLEIYRFYIRCTRCLAEITYKTDPENTDYAIEHGATRNFEAETTARKMEDAKALREEEEMQNPMKILENRTKDSQREMELLETLEELKELNARQSSVDYDALIKQHSDLSKRIENKLFQGERSGLSADQEDEILFNEILAEKKARNIRRLDDDYEESSPTRIDQNTPTTLLAQDNEMPKDENELQEKPNATSILSNAPVAGSRKAFLSKLVQSKNTNPAKNSNSLQPELPKKVPSLLVSYGNSDESKSEESDS